MHNPVLPCAISDWAGAVGSRQSAKHAKAEREAVAARAVPWCIGPNSSDARDLMWAAELLMRKRLVERWRGIDDEQTH